MTSSESASAPAVSPGAPVQRGPKRLVADQRRPLGPLPFAFVATVLGGGAGLGAYVFRSLIALVHNACFLGRLSIHYDATAHTPAGPFGHAVVLAPALGAIVVVFLVKNFAPEAKGHGVPEVIDAIYYAKSLIRPVVAFIKSVASAISIGTGGSVGREGPIVQIAAAFASLLGRVTHCSRWQKATLVAAGGGAGIAATFNTPIGGVLFAVEVLMHEVSVRTLVPVALATATATYVGQHFFGTAPAFEVPPVRESSSLAALPAYLVLGALMGLVAVAFIRALYGAEDLFDKALPRQDYARHAMGMLAVGVTIELMRVMRGHYYVEGVGYATIVDVLTGSLPVGWFLLLLFVLKLLTTSLTLGSGGSGGIFSPSLFMGAMVGGAYGLLVGALFPALSLDPAAMALAGMAGLVAGATGAALTAIVMIFEMTRDYSVVLPMALTVAVSHGLRRALLASNIYTMKLERRGHYMPEALQANAHLVHHVGDIAMAPAVESPAGPQIEAVPTAIVAEPTYRVFMRDGQVVGVIEKGNDQGSPRAIRRDVVVVSLTTTIFDLIDCMQRSKAGLAVVLAASPDAGGNPQVRGVVTKADLAEAIAEGMDIFED